MCFTFWQRFYPTLLSCLAVWGGLAWWYADNSDPGAALIIYTAAILVGIYLWHALFRSIGEQIRFHIAFNRTRRFYQQAARGEYTDRIKL
jgi:hypothetical protein